MTRSNSRVRDLEDLALRVFLAFLAIARRRGPGREPPRGPHRALIVKWCCMGDAVVSLYAIREFKRRNPGVALEMLVSSRIAAVYRGAPEVDAVHVLPVTGHKLARELLNPRLWTRLASLALALRRRRFQEMVDLELYRAHGAVLKRLFGIPFSRGFIVEGSLDKGHDLQVDLPRLVPEWKCFYRVLGMEPPESAPAPLFPRHTVPGRISGSPRIGIVYGSSFNWPQKKWPWEHFSILIRTLREEGCEIVMFGSAPERKEGRRICEEAGGGRAGTDGIRDTSGDLDYPGLLREVSACDLVVGNDTGTMHLAAACGVPTVTLFGPTDPRKWNPLTSTPVYLEVVPCRPCYYLGSMPPCSHFDCLRKMQPALVAQIIRSRLAEISAAEAKALSQIKPGQVPCPGPEEA